MRNKLYIIITCFVILSGIYFFFQIYEEVKLKTVNQLNQHQRVHAKAAADSIQAAFKSYELNLKFLTSIDSIKVYSDAYKPFMKKFYLSNSENIKAVTRIDKNGNIVYTYPFNKKVIGKNVLQQKHNRYIYEKHLPVVSDVFMTLQGYRAIAYAYPVFNNKQYAGCITLLISFTEISKKHLENIKIRKSGYAWMISKSGVELYSPVPGNIGKTVAETFSTSPSIIDMSKKMVIGEEGEAVYFLNEIKGKKVETVKKYAVYFPVKIVNTHWSIVIATPENEVTGLMQGFVNKLIVLFIIIFISVLAVMFYGYNSIVLRREVVQRKRTERQLMDAKIYLNNVVNSMPDILFGMNESGKIENMNQMAEKFSGIAGEEALGKDAVTLFPQFADDLAAILAEKDKDVLICDKKTLDVNGEIKTFQLYSYRLLDGNIAGIVVRIDDISDFEKKEQQIVQSQKMETIGNLAGGLAHDFNNVLGGVLGSIELLEKKLYKEDLQAAQKIFYYIDVLKNSSKRSEDMVKQLLALSRKYQFEKSVIDLNESIGNVVKICKNSFPKSVVIDDSYVSRRAIVLADQTGIEQVILNLMVNASHAMTIMKSEVEKWGGEVKVSVEKIYSDEKFANLYEAAENDLFYFMIEVSDSGVGIVDDLKKSIFDPFFSTKNKNEGTGLGLSMVYNIVKSHGGFIDFYSTPGLGTTFQVFLPEHLAEGGPENADDDDLEKYPGGGLILVIDDESIIRDISRAILTENNYNVLTANDGLSGIEIFKKKQNEISAVLLDMSMPGMSGLDVYLELIKIKPDVKVLLSSGFRLDPRVTKTLEAGADLFISKPYGAQKLLKAMYEVLHGGAG